MFCFSKKITFLTMLAISFLLIEKVHPSQSNYNFLDANSIASILDSKPEARKENSLPDDTSLYRFSMLIPINHYDENNCITLVLKSPNGYRCLQPIDDVSPIREFIPQTDQDPFKWSEIITFHKEIGKGLTVLQVISSLKNSFSNGATNLKIIKDLSEKKDGYETATLALSYTLNGRREVVMMKYYSGPADLGGIQYAIVLENGITEEQALNKIEAFLSDEANYLMFHEIKSPNGMEQVPTPKKTLPLLIQKTKAA